MIKLDGATTQYLSQISISQSQNTQTQEMTEAFWFEEFLPSMAHLYFEKMYRRREQSKVHEVIQNLLEREVPRI